ncbi:hypothetical protein HKX48_002157 [Thoreauomyces humboldtii]|nr:hypothetical protein HKX48_002157 [Thoreauomyces humboldtii]
MAKTTRTVFQTRAVQVFYLVFPGGNNPVLHLGMTGSVKVEGHVGLEYKDFKTADDNFPPKYWKFCLRFKEGGAFAFTDPRRLARIRLVDGDPLLHPPICELGFDPYLALPDIETFSALVLRRKCPIKALLLDQSFSAGVGNWIADENAASLTAAEVGELRSQMSFVVRTAVGVNADSHQFPKDWLFHYRWGKGRTKTREAEMPDGSAIIFETVGGRTSAIVPSVQVLRGQVKAPKAKKRAAKEVSSEEEDHGEEKPLAKRKAKVVKRETKRRVAKVESEQEEEHEGEENAHVKQQSAKLSQRKAGKTRGAKVESASEEGEDEEEPPTTKQRVKAAKRVAVKLEGESDDRPLVAKKSQKKAVKEAVKEEHVRPSAIEGTLLRRSARLK